AEDIFPKGVLNVVTGDGEVVGAALVRHPGVNMVSLTGDVATGKIVAREAAATLKRVHLELGGKAPVIVFDDADLQAVVDGIKIGGFVNSRPDPRPRSSSARCSDRWSRSSASATRTRRWSGRTPSTTGSRPRYGPATSGARCAWRGAFSLGPCGSTRTSRSSTRCLTAATSR